MKILYLPNQYCQQRQREKKRWIYPVHLAMEAEYRRIQGHKIVWECSDEEIHYDKLVSFPEGIDFLKLPPPDRTFTDAFNIKYQSNGNFKFRPATYIQVASGCWYGQCKFCVESMNKWKVRPVIEVYREIIFCKKLGFKEIFDDSGTFPIGPWLDELLGMIPPGIPIGCNMRMIDLNYKRMKDWGFRMLLFGIESANQETLDMIKKGTKTEDVRFITMASKAGLEPHITVMFGFPNETDKDAERTLHLVWTLLRNGSAKTAQASFYCPPDRNNNESHKKFVGRIYDAARFPDFWINKIKDLRSFEDVRYFYRQIKEGITDKLRRTLEKGH